MSGNFGWVLNFVKSQNKPSEIIFVTATFVCVCVRALVVINYREWTAKSNKKITHHTVLFSAL